MSNLQPAGQFVDPSTEGVKSLYRTEAFDRSSYITNVHYQISYALYRGGENFHGMSKIRFSVEADDLANMESKGHKDIVFVDYRGDKVTSLVINDQKIEQEAG